MKNRHFAAILAAKLLRGVIEFSGRGAGSNLPGRVALKISPDIIERLASELKEGAVLISGTNGKTTVSNMIAHILRNSGKIPIHNATGANLISGIASTICCSSDPRKGIRGDIGVFEVDEGALKSAIELTRPQLVVIGNLFRDQLDRYGELEAISKKMRSGLRSLDTTAVLLLNCNDPLVSSLGKGLECNVLYFGLEDRGLSQPGVSSTADSAHCRECGSSLDYDCVFYSHMGIYQCLECGLVCHKPDFKAVDVTVEGVSDTSFTLMSDCEEINVRVPMPGVYNVYNSLEALSACSILGIETKTAVDSLGVFKTAFGRAEQIEAKGRILRLILSKNPTGFNEIIRTIIGGKKKLKLVLALNDRIADGKDVSWIWDVDFQDLTSHAEWIIAAGKRAYDMALRIKYAGFDEEKLFVEEKSEKALDKAVSMSANGDEVFILTTYTATIEMKSAMAKRGYSGKYWQEIENK